MKKFVLVSLAGFLLASPMPAAHADEEQIVIEDLSRAQLRAEIEKIQHEVYRVFNAANDNDELDIVCHDYVPTGSNIREEACEPQFVIDKRAENVADSRFFTDVLLNPAELQSILGVQFQVLTAAMNAVAAENRYYSELNAILKVLRERLEEFSN